MTEKDNGKDFAKDAIEIAGGVVIGKKLTVGGMLYLEEKTGTKFTDIDWNNMTINLAVSLIVAAAISYDDLLVPDTVLDKIKRLGIEELYKSIGGLNEIFNVDLKNQQSPAKTKE